ncbi:MAG: protein kinase [Actinomycetota bacterium]|nr:protein kinase [Actinomycetota bacterium]
MAWTGVSDVVGRVLADRYRVLAPIGVGTSGRVYVATDVRLRRRVALKMLHAALADDAGFVRRFHAEARVAASLDHPNIVTMYDWGEDEVPFMVLELLPGGSLRAMLDAGIRLTPAQAAHVGHQVTAALSYAHHRGLVHRDIKPANLLFDAHGVVHVADLGLARALADASWTEPAGALMGTVRYAAPELGTGVTLDGRADLYALSVVLVEAVTGRVPEVADTPIGTLARRAQTSLCAPDELGALGTVIERAGRGQPSERYPDAETMREALSEAAGRLPPAGPLTLIGLGTQLNGPNEPRLGRTVVDQGADDAVAMPRVTPDLRTPIQVSLAPRPGRHTPRGVPIIVGALMLAVLVVAGVLLAWSTAGGTVSVPQLVGLPQDEALRRATHRGLVVDVEQREADDPRGRVVLQSPEAGSWLHDGAVVHLVVSRGPRPVAIPNVAGKPQGEATLLLIGAGFAVDTKRSFDENVPPDIVIRTDPAANEKRAPETPVTLIVSDGSASAVPTSRKPPPRTNPAPAPSPTSISAPAPEPPPTPAPPSAPAPSPPPDSAPPSSSPAPEAGVEGG